MISSMNLFKRALRAIRYRILLRSHVYKYNKRLPYILNRIQKKKKIRILFFCNNISMWKYDGLFRLLLADSRFDPIIIPFLYPQDEQTSKIKIQDEIHRYCETNTFPYIEAYNFMSDEYNRKVRNLEPDVIVYTQPYNYGYKDWLIESFWESCIFFYTPYCFPMEDLEVFYDTLLQNICWKLFLPTENHRLDQSRIAINKGQNVVVVGYPLYDAIQSCKSSSIDVWKIKNRSMKRVIWAPHHSILERDTLHYSRFLQIADLMLEVANRYRDNCQFAFKPHPLLRDKLYKVWGIERTNQYYDKWNSLSNAHCYEEDYVELFFSSDAMIHDCSSFMAEYLYTMRPIMFIGEKVNNLNSIGVQCLNLHYKGQTIEDIERFLNEVVLSQQDPLESKRIDFYNKVLRPPGGVNVAKIMYDEICKLFD